MIPKKQSSLYDEYAVTIDTGFNKGQSIFPFGAYQFIKRFYDIMFALIGLIFAFPILMTFCLAIKLETPGSAFFYQERVGLNGRYFRVIKLRSMGIHAEKNGAQWAEKNDPRVTKVGAFIRKTRIDEIPQLINVLKGDMSLVGPRPERPMFTAQFNEEIPGFVQRLAVKPGITGWAQVNGGYDITPKEKLELDMEYIRKQSIRFDLKILLYTVKVVLTGNGAR
ncbi:sugar transferase [Halalkalibacterium ligniniphilum]|uniref:sugar transferase n=1 Tax=Halalkalibacterium ligniniphilum TaxID=1134413 RepID=UPI00373AE550